METAWAWPLQQTSNATKSLIRPREEEESPVCSNPFASAPAAAASPFQILPSGGKRHRQALLSSGSRGCKNTTNTKTILILYRSDVFKESAQGLCDVMTRGHLPARTLDFQVWQNQQKAAAWRGMHRSALDGMMGGYGVDENVGLYIIFGANLMTQGDLIPRPYVIYQTEQLKSRWMTEEYLAVLKGAASVWEFSVSHVHHWRVHHKINAVYVPMFAPFSTLFTTNLQLQSPHRHLPDPQPIDILFYGLRNDRRETLCKRMLQLAGQYNLNVKFFMSYDLFGDQREAAIAQSKVVLNVHFYEDAALETHRIVYLLCKAKCVVSETSSDTMLDNQFRNKVVFCTYEEMPWRAVELVMDTPRRKTLEAHGFNFMNREHSDLGHVREALSASSFDTQPSSQPPALHTNAMVM